MGMEEGAEEKKAWGFSGHHGQEPYKQQEVKGNTQGQYTPLSQHDFSKSWSDCNTTKLTKKIPPWIKIHAVEGQDSKHTATNTPISFYGG